MSPEQQEAGTSSRSSRTVWTGSAQKESSVTLNPRTDTEWVNLVSQWFGFLVVLNGLVLLVLGSISGRSFWVFCLFSFSSLWFCLFSSVFLCVALPPSRISL